MATRPLRPPWGQAPPRRCRRPSGRDAPDISPLSRPSGARAPGGGRSRLHIAVVSPTFPAALETGPRRTERCSFCPDALVELWRSALRGGRRARSVAASARRHTSRTTTSTQGAPPQLDEGIRADRAPLGPSRPRLERGRERRTDDRYVQPRPPSARCPCPRWTR